MHIRKARRNGVKITCKIGKKSRTVLSASRLRSFTNYMMIEKKREFIIKTNIAEVSMVSVNEIEKP